ncbi:MAG: SHOCT domain-containing protein [Chloroflexi bacterium]|nr:SHOCT domain-containing protein [Chloroflexota bacterium]
MWWTQGMGWWMVLGGLLTIIFWGAIIALIVWVVKKLTERGGGTVSTGRSPLDIAKERYARGEITKEQFEQLKKDLM